MDRYVKLVCRLKNGPAGNDEILLASLYSSGFEAFEEIQNGIIGYSVLDQLSMDQIEDQIIRNPRFAERWDFIQEIIESENWNEEWEKNFPPVVINEQCRIKALFHDPVPGFRYEITIQPRMAFGTGHHETTALMIKEVLKVRLTGKKVLDVGCGTAVLSILCSMKGAGDIIGLDNDPLAVESAAGNISLNNAKNIRLVKGELPDIPDRDFDLLLANITLNYITGHMQEFAGHVKPGGTIICSGFFHSDFTVLESTVPNGLSLEYYKVENQWMVCVFKKNK